MSEKWINTTEAARLARVTPATISRKCAAGRLRSKQGRGRARLVCVADLRKMYDITESEKPTAAPTNKKTNERIAAQSAQAKENAKELRELRAKLAQVVDEAAEMRQHYEGQLRLQAEQHTRERQNDDVRLAIAENALQQLTERNSELNLQVCELRNKTAPPTREELELYKRRVGELVQVKQAQDAVLLQQVTSGAAIVDKLWIALRSERVPLIANPRVADLERENERLRRSVEKHEGLLRQEVAANARRNGARDPVIAAYGYTPGRAVNAKVL